VPKRRQRWHDKLYCVAVSVIKLSKLALGRLLAVLSAIYTNKKNAESSHV